MSRTTRDESDPRSAILVMSHKLVSESSRMSPLWSKVLAQAVDHGTRQDKGETEEEKFFIVQRSMWSWQYTFLIRLIRGGGPSLHKWVPIQIWQYTLVPTNKVICPLHFALCFSTPVSLMHTSQVQHLGEDEKPTYWVTYMVGWCDPQSFLIQNNHFSLCNSCCKHHWNIAQDIHLSGDENNPSCHIRKTWFLLFHAF